MPSQRIREYAQTLAEVHGTNGHAVASDGRLVHSAYREDDYDLFVDGQRLTDVEGDLTSPQWLDGRGSILALLDADGAERHDLVEVDPETGAVTPILEDDHQVLHPIVSPTDPDRIAFVSTRDRSLDVYTTQIGDDEVTKHSTADDLVLGLDWAPDGERLVYQAGLMDSSSVRLADLADGRDEPLFDRPDSEQAITFMDGGHHAWSDEGIVFTTNHGTGYREVAVGDATGEFQVRYENERDKYDARWIHGSDDGSGGPGDDVDGDIAFLEAQEGNRVLRVLAGETATTVAGTGVNGGVEVYDGDLYYSHADAASAGDVYRNDERLTMEGVVDLPTVEPGPVTYASFDDLAVPALLYEPEGESRGALVKAHGGPEAQHFNGLDAVTQTLVHEGFTVLAADVRGSTGYGRAFRKRSDGDLGGDDLQDLVAGAEYLRDRGHASVGITGGSYGGYMTLMGVAATDAFDAGASVVGVVNWKTVVEDARGYIGDELMRKLGGTPDERPEFYAERSPITYVDDISVPLLVVQGANDPRVPQSEAEQIVSSMADREIPHEYLLFEDEGHGVVRTENRVEYIERMVSFFDEHL